MTSSFYKTVYQRKFKELPKWKQSAIVEDSQRNHWSGILTDFVKAVIEEAEKEYLNSKNTPSIIPVDVEPIPNRIEKISKSKKN